MFHCIRYLYSTSLFVRLSATAKYCSRVLEAYRSRQDRSYWHPAKILEQRNGCLMLMIAPSFCYFPVWRFVHMKFIVSALLGIYGI